MSESAGKFNLSMNRSLFIGADPETFESLKNALKAHYFLVPKALLSIPDEVEEPYFVMCVIDFDKPSAVQTSMRLMEQMTSPLASKLIFSLKPGDIAAEWLLLAQEVGVRFVAYGEERYDELKQYLKQVCIDDHKAGGSHAFEKEFAAAYKSHDMDRVRRTIARLKETGAEGEGTHTLLAQAYQKLGEVKLAEFHLKQILEINRQNLWAANTLGRMLLGGGRMAEGMEILERLSLFHNLNGERLLVLGHAYADVGEGKRAEELFRMGDDLNEGTDDRFQSGLVKAKLAQGDVAAALELAGSQGFSEEMIRFLNMRAILSMRRGQTDEAMSFYEQAMQGAKEDLMQSKLYFNMGLAHVRGGDLVKAEEHLEKSAQLGGRKFSRAQGPLGIVQRLLSKGKSGAAEPDLMDDIEYETMF